jgi:hypothetical protein
MRHENLWAANVQVEENRPIGVPLDRELVDTLRDLKGLLLPEKNLLERFKSQVLQRSELEDFDSDKLKAIDAKFGALTKSLLTLAANVSNTREFKQLFTNLAEEIGEMLGKLELRDAEADALMKALISAFADPAFAATLHSSPSHQERYARCWTRFMAVIRECIRMFYARKVI